MAAQLVNSAPYDQNDTYITRRVVEVMAASCLLRQQPSVTTDLVQVVLLRVFVGLRKICLDRKVPAVFLEEEQSDIVVECGGVV